MKWSILLYCCTFLFANKLYTQTVKKESHHKERETSDAPSTCHQSCVPKLEAEHKECKKCCNPNQLVYDFKCKHFYYKGQWAKNPSDIKAFYNEEFKVKVVNINRYIYNVEVNADDNYLTSEQPVLFKKLFTGEDFDVSDLMDRSMMVAADPGNEDESLQSRLAQALDSFVTLRRKLLNDQFNAHSHRPVKCKCCCDKDSLIYKKISEQLSRLKNTTRKFEIELLEEARLIHEGIDSSKKEIEKIKNEIRELEKKILNSRDAKERQILGRDTARLNSKLNDSLRALGDRIGIGKDYEKQKVNINDLKTYLSQFTEEDLLRMSLFSHNLVCDHFVFNSAPIFPQGNMLSIGIKISPTDSSLIKKWNIMPLYNDSFGLYIFVRNKWFISFSSGPFLAFGNQLRNEEYAWQAQPDANTLISDSSKYILASAGNGRAPLGFAAFAHLERKFRRNLGLGISPGVGITIESKPRPAYFLGASFFAGDQRQFALAAGACLISVDRLKSNLYTGIGTTRYISNTGEIDYSQKLKGGLFVSISYTFFSIDRSRNSANRSSK